MLEGSRKHGRAACIHPVSGNVCCLARKHDAKEGLLWRIPEEGKHNHAWTDPDAVLANVATVLDG